MRKLIYTIIAIVFISNSLIGQNISLSDDHGPIGPNDTVFYYGDINSLIVSHVFVTNNSASSMDIKCVREEIYTVPGSQNYFCWDNCYDPTIDSSGIEAIDAGATNKNNFSGDYEAFGSLGKSYIKYKFYNANNVSESASVLVEYNATGVGVEDNSRNDIELNVFPNPVSTQANIGFALNNEKAVQIIISDIIGNTIYISEGQFFPAGKNKIAVDMNEINPGMYFVKVLVDDRVFTKKIYKR